MWQKDRQADRRTDRGQRWTPVNRKSGKGGKRCFLAGDVCNWKRKTDEVKEKANEFE